MISDGGIRKGYQGTICLAFCNGCCNDKFLVREAQCGIGARKVLCYVVGPRLDLIRGNDSSGFVWTGLWEVAEE